MAAVAAGQETLEEDTQLLSGTAAVRTGLSLGLGVDRGPPFGDHCSIGSHVFPFV